MINIKKIIFLSASIVIIFVISGYLLKDQLMGSPVATSSATPSATITDAAAVSFLRNGNLAKSGENWQIIYEEPGKPALSANLVFNDKSGCVASGALSKCDMTQFKIGEPVIIEGSLKKDILTVAILNPAGNTGDSSFPSDETVIAGMTEAFVSKYNRSAASFAFKVSEKDASHARGSVRLKDETDGKFWFGAIDKNKWVLVFDGQGDMDCVSAEKYKFSNLMVPSCIDTKNGDALIQR